MSSLKINKARYGPLKAGQYWKKIDIGQVMYLSKKIGGGRWMCVFPRRKGNGCHSISENVIYQYYEKLG